MRSAWPAGVVRPVVHAADEEAAVNLLDANVWVAAGWANHQHHALVKAWLDPEPGDLCFCWITQAAFLRLVSNAAVTGAHTLTRRQAWVALDALLADPRVRFLQEPPGLERLWRSFSDRDDRGHQVWNDDYLAAFALADRATLVTLDRTLERRYPSVDVLTLRNQRHE